MFRPIPPRIETPRLVLRCWREEDAPRLKAAIDGSLAHLRPWLPWAAGEPTPLAQMEERLRQFRARFEAGEEWIFGIFDGAETSVLGGVGLHPRLGPGALEIGYWIRGDSTGRGIATEAASALTSLALAAGVGRVEIHCDPANVRSARVPARLGYRLFETRRGDGLTPDGRPRDTQVWVFPPNALPGG